MTEFALRRRSPGNCGSRSWREKARKAPKSDECRLPGQQAPAPPQSIDQSTKHSTSLPVDTVVCGAVQGDHKSPNRPYEPSSGAAEKLSSHPFPFNVQDLWFCVPSNLVVHPYRKEGQVDSISRWASRPQCQRQVVSWMSSWTTFQPSCARSSSSVLVRPGCCWAFFWPKKGSRYKYWRRPTIWTRIHERHTMHHRLCTNSSGQEFSRM